MFTAFAKIVMALWPFVKESLFGKKPLPMIIHKNRTVYASVILNILLLSAYLLQLDSSIMLLDENRRIKDSVVKMEALIETLQNDVKRLEADSSSKQHVERLESMIVHYNTQNDRLVEENERLRLRLAEDEKPRQ